MFDGYSDGWVKLWRKIQDHEFYKEKRIFSRYEAWLDMIQWANHQDNSFLIGNEVIKCQRGSFVTSEQKLMNHWGWSKEKTRRFLNVCERCEMVDRKADRRKTTITLINYNGYQSYQTEKRPISDHEETTKRPPRDHERDTTKEDKNVKTKRIKEKPLKTMQGFEEFWFVYPKKKSIGDAEKAWSKINPDSQLILKIMTKIELLKQSEDWQKEKGKYIPFPATWLNAKGWEDEVDVKIIISDTKGKKDLQYEIKSDGTVEYLKELNEGIRKGF